MKWQEVIKLYLGQYVLLEELKSYIEENQKYISDIAKQKAESWKGKIKRKAKDNTKTSR